MSTGKISVRLKVMDNRYNLHEIKNKVVLLSALDWGMGHTARCVHIIKILFSLNNKLVFAGNEKQCDFLKKDFPEMECVHLAGYNISLNSKKNTYVQLAKQFGQLKRVMKCERKWLENFVANREIDYIVSDNRYGFYHPSVTSVLLTHQLNLQIPFFMRLANGWLTKSIERFDACWVPDTADHALSGELSKRKLNIPTHFIGHLCRFKALTSEKEYDFLVILSGPEPERSNFLNDMLNEFSEPCSKGCVAFVGAHLSNFDSFQNPSTAELELLIAKSDIIISRAGYTTIMEMVCLNKKARLYPTKGQYEQEYLAKTIKHQQIEFVFTK